MRTAYRVLSTAIAVGAIFPIGTLPAHAQASTTSEVKVETAAWFWSGQTSGTVPEAGLPLPNLPADKTGVPAGDLAVAYKGEKETLEKGGEVTKPDKETYLAWDIYFIPEGSYVDSFTFTLFLDPAAEQVYVPQEVEVPSQVTHGGVPDVVACLPTIGFGSGEGDAFAVKPADDCSEPLYGSYDEKTMSYTFDASVYAQDWVDGKDNFGLGFRPALDAPDPFQLVFKGAKDVKATITYTPAEAEPTAPPVIDPVVPLPQPPTDVSVFVPSGPQVQPQPQAEPQAPPVVAVTQAPVVVQNVAATPLVTTRGLSPVFWLAMVAGVLFIGVTSLILGDPLEPAAAARGRARTTGRHRLAPAGAVGRTTRPVRPRTV